MKNYTNTSEIFEDEGIIINQLWDICEEIPTYGYSRLIIAKRYGVKYVLKCLKSTHSDKVMYKELLRKEFNILTNLQHANIQRIIGWENIPRVGACIITEYIDGMNLDDFLQTFPNKETRIKIAEELSEALSYIHSKQIVHRDLKPSNILITNNGKNVKIIDFGLSDTDSYEILKQGAGTENYSAPEQLRGEFSDCQCDIYSFGKVLAKLELPYPYKQVIKKCCSERTLRYKNIQSFKNDLKRRKRYLNLLSALIFIILLLWGATTFSPKFPNHPNEKEGYPIEHIIAKGKDLIDEAKIPALEYTDTVKEKNIDTYYHCLGLMDTITIIVFNYCQKVHQEYGTEIGLQVEMELGKYQMDFTMKISKDFGLIKE